jgi:hypothetical protein
VPNRPKPSKVQFIQDLRPSFTPKAWRL